MKCHVLVDFDGTIVPEDATNQLLETFADPSWLEIEAQWQSGAIGSRECMERQIDLVRATPLQLDDFLSTIRIDPYFHQFVRLCEKHQARVTVVSDGLDRAIRKVLAAARLNLPYVANHLEWRGENRWRLTFPNARSDCRTLMGNCKCSVAEGPADVVRIMVGDGRSDFCIAETAHFVLAKGRLAEHCRDNDLAHVEFRDFKGATGILARWFEENLRDGLGHSTSAGEKL